MGLESRYRSDRLRKEKNTGIRGREDRDRQTDRALALWSSLAYTSMFAWRPKQQHPCFSSQ